MRRYFESLNVGRPFEVGGRSFVFEPSESKGGFWVGVLAVDDESAASILVSVYPRVWEITAEQYEAKKKRLQPSAPSRARPTSRFSRNGSAQAAEAEDGSPPPPVEPGSPAEVYEIRVTAEKPPVEPLLVEHGKRRKNS